MKVVHMMVRLVTVVFLAFCSTVRAEPTDPAKEIKVSGKQGETVNVSVVVHDATDLGAFEFHMEIDPAVVDVAEVGLADFMGSTGRNIMRAGPSRSDDKKMVMFGAYSMGTSPGPGGDGVLAVVALKFLKDGESTVKLVKAQVTDVKGQAMTFPVLLRTDVQIERIEHLEARRFVITLDPGDDKPAALRRKEVTGAARQMLEQLLYQGDAAKAEKQGRKIITVNRPAGKVGAASSADGTLIVIDTPQALDKVTSFLSTGKEGKQVPPAYASLWVLDSEVPVQLDEIFKEATFNESNITQIHKMIESGEKRPLGFRLATIDSKKGRAMEDVPLLMDAEVRRIKAALESRPTLALGLPGRGVLLAISDFQTLDYLERNILHTLAAGKPGNWKLLAIQDESVHVLDEMGYLQRLPIGKPDASGISVVNANKASGTARIRRDQEEIELKIDPLPVLPPKDKPLK